jgi:hypothetical protein
MTPRAFLLALLSTAACVTSPEPKVEITAAPPLVFVPPSSAKPLQSEVSDPGEVPPTTPDDSPCACETAQCVSDWLKANNDYCGLCVTIVCDDGRKLGGCVPCS